MGEVQPERRDGSHSVLRGTKICVIRKVRCASRRANPVYRLAVRRTAFYYRFRRVSLTKARDPNTGKLFERDCGDVHVQRGCRPQWICHVACHHLTRYVGGGIEVTPAFFRERKGNGRNPKQK